MTLNKLKLRNVNLPDLLIVIFCLAISVAATIRSISFRKEVHEIAQQLDIKSHDLSNEQMTNALLCKSIEQIYAYNGRMVNNEPLINSEGDTTLLYTLLNKSPMLILRFSEISCNVCIDSQIDLVKKFVSMTDQSKFALIVTYENAEHMNRFKRLNDIDYEIFNFSGSLTGSQESEFPFYFILDQGYFIKDTFIPIKELPGLTENYFNQMVIKHFGL